MSNGGKSPFAEDESLMIQLKSWAHQDLEHLTMKKLSTFTNDVLLSDWSAAQLNICKISFPVSKNIVARWLVEAGFKYTLHKTV